MKKFLKGIAIVYILSLLIGNSASFIADKFMSRQDQDNVKKVNSLTVEERKSIHKKYSSAGKAVARFILSPFVEAADSIASKNPELHNREPWTIDESFKIPPKVEVPSIEERMKDTNAMSDAIKKEQFKNK